MKIYRLPRKKIGQLTSPVWKEMFDNFEESDSYEAEYDSEKAESNNESFDEEYGE